MNAKKIILFVLIFVVVSLLVWKYVFAGPVTAVITPPFGGIVADNPSLAMDVEEAICTGSEGVWVNLLDDSGGHTFDMFPNFSPTPAMTYYLPPTVIPKAGSFGLDKWALGLHFQITTIPVGTCTYPALYGATVTFELPVATIKMIGFSQAAVPAV